MLGQWRCVLSFRFNAQAQVKNTILLAFAPEGSFYNKQGLLQILNNELAYLLFLTFWHTFPENEYLTLMPDGFYEDHNLLDELAVIFTWYFFPTTRNLSRPKKRIRSLEKKQT